jgi:hypothetical protein
MTRKKGHIIIKEYEEGELYRKSMENCRLNDLKKKADIEAEWEYQKKHCGSPMPISQYKQYLIDLVGAWQRSKVVKLF